MFESAIAEGKAVAPFAVEVALGRYWLTRLKSKQPTPAIAAFESWILVTASQGADRAA
jgi:LysR family transcriptional regulator of beta-lactamase